MKVRVEVKLSSQLEPLSLSHLQELALMLQVWQRQPGHQAFLNWNENSLKESLLLGQGWGLVDIKGKLYGAALLSKTYPQESEILLFLVSWEMAGHGGAHYFMELIKKTHQRLILEVHEGHQRAINFYKKQGFRIDGQRLKYYRDGGTAILMSWGI